MDKNLFFDSQLSNPNITWRLYSQPSTANEDGVQNTPDYSNLLAVGILNDTELGVDISHSYGEGAFDPFKSVGELVGMLPGAVGQVGQKTVEALNPKNFMPVINSAGIVANSIPALSQFMNQNIEALGVNFNPSQLVGSQFLSAFDLIKTFTGSSIDIGLPILETIWFHEDDNTVKKRIASIQDKLLGDLDHLGGLFGLQKSPNGYLPKLTNLSEDVQFTGSFRLHVGSMYDIDNLIVTNFSYKLSTFNAMTKKFLDGDRTPSREPLYAIIRIQVAPAAFLTKAKLRKYLGMRTVSHV